MSAKYGIGFWKPGSGIIHQVVLEQYAFPGGMMIGTDSHTPNAGGLGMIAIGVGGADAVDVMTGYPFNVRWPKLIGVHLTGELNGWSAPKDVILKVAEILTVKGGTGAIVEYFGPGADVDQSAPARPPSATWAPRSAPPRRCSPTTTPWPATSRPPAARPSPTPPTPSPHDLRADDEVLADPGGYFDQVIEIDLSTSSRSSTARTPPTWPARSPARRRGRRPRAGRIEISAALVGSCTNSSYEDITRAASHRPPGRRRTG